MLGFQSVSYVTLSPQLPSKFSTFRKICRIRSISSYQTHSILMSIIIFSFLISLPVSKHSLSHSHSSRAMDWFAWLSKSSLEPSLVYEYGILFSRNELQIEDVAFFNHEFLLSMGVTVAKHRLEILKLAKEGHHQPRAISRLGLALMKTKKCFSKYFTRMASQETDMSLPPKYVADQQEKYQEHWRGSLLRKPEVRTTRSIALSGPLDMRTHERLMMVPNPRNLKLSGPLDSKFNERLMYTTNKSPRLTSTVSDKLTVAANKSPKTAGPLDGRSYDRLMVSTNRSPKLSGPLDGRVTPYEKENADFDDHSLWTAMFQDMKPT